MKTRYKSRVRMQGMTSKTKMILWWVLAIGIGHAAFWTLLLIGGLTASVIGEGGERAVQFGGLIGIAAQLAVPVVILSTRPWR